MAASSIASPVAQLVPVVAHGKASASGASHGPHWLCPALLNPQRSGAALSGRPAFALEPALSGKGELPGQSFCRGLQVRCASKAATSGNVVEPIEQRTRLHDLYNQQGQSPWLDNLTRYRFSLSLGWIRLQVGPDLYKLEAAFVLCSSFWKPMWLDDLFPLCFHWFVLLPLSLISCQANCPWLACNGESGCPRILFPMFKHAK